VKCDYGKRINRFKLLCLLPAEISANEHGGVPGLTCAGAGHPAPLLGAACHSGQGITQR